MLIFFILAGLENESCLIFDIQLDCGIVPVGLVPVFHPKHRRLRTKSLETARSEGRELQSEVYTTSDRERKTSHLRDLSGEV